ncbi:MAG: hypothetical protein AAB225_07560 [Acidobacteriota bacterium]
MILRRFWTTAVVLGAAALWAAPPLTTVQDVLYKADGTPFNGVAFIEWKTFDASDQSKIATHRLAVPIVRGVIRVRLVPTTTATPQSTYLVRYNSDGKVQFEETWAVPPSSVPLRIRDIRVAAPPVINPPPLTEPIQESDVIGLVEDLAARPVKGPGYASSRAAFIGTAGALEAVVGELSDCVRVDGTAGPCGTGGGGGAGAVFIDGETPSGEVDGANATFVLSNSPTPGSTLALYRNGLLQKQVLDYSISGNVITFTGGSIPQPTDLLSASYRLPATGSAAHNLLSATHPDTVAGTPARGDLIVGAGISPTYWTRLPLGQANRCLVSNGQEAGWNACLFTGFTAGSVPFIDASGNLTQNNSGFVWDTANRRLSLGNNSSLTTLYVWDALPSTGVTGLALRAGEGQGASPVQTWMDVNGGNVASVDAEGNFAGASFRAASSSLRAAWRDGGSATDPAGAVDGDFWYNSGGLARKTAEGSQVHALSQVVCSATGSSTSATSLMRLGSCTVPAGFLKPGDRVDIRFDFSHQGAATGFSFEVRWGATSVVARSAAAGESLATGRADAAIRSTGAQWSVQSWGTTLSLAAAVGAAADSLAVPLTLDFLGSMAAATTETVTLESFTVIRYPAQANP